MQKNAKIQKGEEIYNYFRLRLVLNLLFVYSFHQGRTGQGQTGHMGHGMSARITEDSIDTETPITGVSKGGQLRILARSGKTAELRALISTFGGAVAINALRNGDEVGPLSCDL